MKKTILSIAICMFAGNMMAQNTDKAAAKAAAAALKAAQKEAKTLMADAQKIKDVIYAKYENKENPASEEEVITECRKGQEMITKAIKGGQIEPKRIGEAYKLSGDLAILPHNLYLQDAVDKLPFDTVNFYDNLFILTDALHNELLNTKEVKGEQGNVEYLKGKRLSLAQSGDYFIYAAQFESECKRYDRAIAAYDFAINYAKTYPEIADELKMRITPEQIAYYTYHCAHEAGNYEAMEKYYPMAVKFEQGALGTKQVRAMSYLERGDSAAWAGYIRELCLEDPKGNTDFIQVLLSYYQKQGMDKMAQFADEVIAKDENILIANYGKAYIYFQGEKYDEALKYYLKCTEIDPTYYDAWYQSGLCKFRQALKLNTTISSIKNQNEAKKVLEQTKKLFGDAIPYFEKARECTPDQPQKWAYELRQCYTVTGQSAKAAEMDALL